MRLGSALGWGVGMLAALAANCGSSDDSGLFTESGGSGGDAGSSGSSAGVFGAAGDGVGGNGGFGGTAGFGGQDASDPDTSGFGGSSGTGGGNCAQYCADSDGDGHGDPTKRPTVCANLGSEWITICDDCHDQNPDVFPGATNCRAEPYVLADGVGRSFDYDCSGSATECGEVIKATGSCAPSGFVCTGAGYVQNPDRVDAGMEANPYCGSTRYRLCNRNPLGCAPTTEMREPVTCL